MEVKEASSARDRHFGSQAADGGSEAIAGHYCSAARLNGAETCGQPSDGYGSSD